MDESDILFSLWFEFELNRVFVQRNFPCNCLLSSIRFLDLISILKEKLGSIFNFRVTIYSLILEIWINPCNSFNLLCLNNTIFIVVFETDKLTNLKEKIKLIVEDDIKNRIDHRIIVFVDSRVVSDLLNKELNRFLDEKFSGKTTSSGHNYRSISIVGVSEKINILNILKDYIYIIK